MISCLRDEFRFGPYSSPFSVGAEVARPRNDAGKELGAPRGKYLGHDADGIAQTEADHFMRCPGCDKWFDMRDLGQVPTSAFSRLGPFSFGPRLSTLIRKNTFPLERPHRSVF